MLKHCRTHTCRWRRRKKARPAEIIDAALELFVTRGFSATRLEDIARHAGISKGTLYLYFDSKEDLFRAVVEQIIVPEIEKAEKHAAEFYGSQRQLIVQLLSGWWNAIGKTRLAGIPKIMVAEAANFPELAKFYMQNVVVRTRNIIHKALLTGVDSGEFKALDPIITTRLLIAPVVFAVIWQKSLAAFDDEQYDVDQYIQTHISLFMDSIKKA